METTTQTGLMKKTKAQLVDIILRKDSVEKELRDIIKTHNESLEHIRIEDKKKDANFKNLKIDFENICDELSEYTCLYETERKSNLFFKIISIVLFIVVLIEIFI